MGRRPGANPVRLSRWCGLLVSIAFLGLLMLPAMASAWLSWDGIDPLVAVGSHTVAIRVEWPSEKSCNVGNPVRIEVTVPDKEDARVLPKRVEREAVCGKRLVTVTTLSETRPQSDPDEITVSARINISDGDDDEEFPVRVVLTVDDSREVIFEGDSEHGVKGKVDLGP